MKKIVSLIVLLHLLQQCIAQNVGIGTTSPNASAALDISATDKGLLMPRLTTLQRNAIAAPIKGLQIYNTDDGCLDSYDGALWTKTCGLKTLGPALDPAHPIPNSWVERLPMPTLNRENGVGFSLGNKAFVGLGIGLKDWWEYDLPTTTWIQKPNFPGAGTYRYAATGFVIGNSIYVGTGVNQLNNYMNDFWEYNTITNVWTQRANFPVARERAIGFSVNGKGYIGTGRTTANAYTNDLWEYNPGSDVWIQVANVPGVARYSGIAFTIGSKSYIGLGESAGILYPNDFYEYDPTSNAFTTKASMNGGRSDAVGFSMNGKGYVGTGFNTTTSNSYDFWEYNATSNIWIQKASFINNRRFGIGFGISNKAFITGGYSFSNFIQSDFWEYMDNNQTGGASYSSVSPILASPNNLFNDGSWSRINNNVFTSTIGNVGIGTATPNYKLEVAGSAAVTGNLFANSNANVGGTLGVIGSTNLGNALNVEGSIRTKYSGTIVQNVAYQATAYTVTLTIPALPTGWDFTNTLVLVTIADGNSGIIYSTKLTSVTNIALFFQPNASGPIRFNYIVFKL